MYSISIKNVFIISLFLLFFYPLSVNGISANYSFLLVPLYYALLYRKLKKPDSDIRLILGFYCLVFMLATIYQFDYYEVWTRRLVSFILFFSVFAYMFIEINSSMVNNFKLAIILISLYFSVTSISDFYLFGGSTLGFEAKDLVGGQRFGFIYLMGIWLTYFYEAEFKHYKLIKYAVFLVLLIGLLLTFSRSSIVGLFGGFGIYFLLRCYDWLKRPKLKTLFRSILAVSGIGLIVFVLYQLVPLVFTFFDTRLLSLLIDSSTASERLANTTGSEGYRVYIIGKILDFVVRNPLTGSGYLGVWIFDATSFGSAHGQFNDVLFRTGIIGFVAYLYLMYKLCRFFYSTDKALFWGLISVLIYGLFHETFKESQGSFLLAFLLGMMSQSFREKRVLQRGATASCAV